MIALDQTFDAEFANTIARLESYNKHLYRPNTYLHKWWARRCGTTFRLLLKGLAEDAADRDFYAPGGLEGVTILDPMMGGGTTIHEAIRLGANVIGADVDPIPILQARASLSSLPSPLLSEAFGGLIDVVQQTLEPFLTVFCPECDAPTPLRFTLYGLRRRCQCGPAIHVDSYILRHGGNESITALCAKCRKIHDGTQCQESAFIDDRPPIYEKSLSRCPNCCGKFKDDLDRLYYDRYSPLVSVGVCEDHGLFFKGIETKDLEQIGLADSERRRIKFQGNLSIEPGPKSNALIRRGITRYSDLFSSRQLIYLKTAIDYLDRCDSNARLPLALIVSTSLEFNSMLCGYKGTEKRRAGAIRHAFSHHAYSFPYTALENNPVYPTRASGTLNKLFHDRVVQARKWAARPRERVILGNEKKYISIPGEVDSGTEVTDPDELKTGKRKYYLLQGSSISISLNDSSVDFIVTDPPYYDSVEYGDLAAFFRVWLQMLVGESVDGDIDWNYNIPHFARDRGVKDRRSQTYEHYSNLMGGIFAECQRLLRKDLGRLIFTFHHWKPDSWAALTVALQRAGFFLVNRYVVHSENPISVHINNLRALTDDAILVLAPDRDATHRAWPQVSELNLNESAAFCSDCGSVLGWLLASNMTESEIRSVWRKLLESK